MPRRFVAFVNPSTRGNAKRLIRILRDAAPDDVILETHETTAGLIDPTLISDIDDIEAVIAVGGDGTVAEVASALGDRAIPLGIVPGGSTNIVARYLGVPSNAARAAKIIFGPHALRPIDAGVWNNKRFLHMAGAGFDSRLFMQTSRSLKRRMGWMAYIEGAARSVFMPPSRFTINVDGNTIELVSPLVMIANGAAIVHPKLSIFPEIRNDDGLLDVIIFSATNTKGVMSALFRFLTGSLPSSRGVMRLQGKCITLSAVPAMPVQLDGDVVGETPATFSIAGQKMNIIVPKKR